MHVPRTQEPCPGRAAASFTLLRRAGTHTNIAASVGPGSAARTALQEPRHSPPKTRANALTALRPGHENQRFRTGPQTTPFFTKASTSPLE